MILIPGCYYDGAGLVTGAQGKAMMEDEGPDLIARLSLQDSTLAAMIEGEMAQAEIDADADAMLTFSLCSRKWLVQLPIPLRLLRRKDESIVVVSRAQPPQTAAALSMFPQRWQSRRQTSRVIEELSDVFVRDGSEFGGDGTRNGSQWSLYEREN